MGLEIQIEVQEEFMLVTASGTMEFHEALRLLKHVFNTAAERGINKILVDALRTDGQLSTLDRFELGSLVAEHVGRPAILPRLAIVGKLPQIDGLGARVAQNRGLSVEVFPGRQEALRWLGCWPGLNVSET